MISTGLTERPPEPRSNPPWLRLSRTA